MSFDIIRSSGQLVDKKASTLSESLVPIDQRMQMIENQFHSAVQIFNDRLNQLQKENSSLYRRLDEMAIQRDRDLLVAAKEIHGLHEKQNDHEILIREKSEKIQELEKKLNVANKKTDQLQTQIFEQQDQLQLEKFELKDLQFRFKKMEEENRKWKEEKLKKLWKDYISPPPIKYANMSQFGMFALSSYPITAGLLAGGVYAAARFYFTPKLRARLLIEIKELSLDLDRDFEKDLKNAEDAITEIAINQSFSPSENG